MKFKDKSKRGLGNNLLNFHECAKIISEIDKYKNRVLNESALLEGAHGNIHLNISTNGYCGGDSGHGARAIITLTHNNYNLRVLQETDSSEVDFNAIDKYNGFLETISIIAQGDEEISQLISSLETSASKLKEMVNKLRKKEE